MKTFGRQDIKDYEGRYAVYPNGQIWSYPKKYRPIGSFIKGTNKGNTGYQMVSLSGDKKKYISVHQIVAKTFLVKPKGKYEVNHINGIKTDNRVENLEWVTRKDNCLHSHRILGNTKYGLTNHTTKIISIDKGGRKKKFNSVKEASIINKCSAQSIVSVLKGRRNSCNNIKYFYA